MIALAFGCTNSTSQNQEGKAGLKDASVESITKPAEVDNDRLIVPGKSIGKIFLGQDVKEMSKMLGTPDDGDAAMGKAWGIWHLDGGDLSVYSSYKDSTATSRDVKQVVVSAEGYKTKEGFGKGTSIEEIRKTYPNLQRVETYILEGAGDTLKVFDEVKEGIAFDVITKGNKHINAAITVHAKNIPVNSTYLTIHPGWKRLE